MSRRSESAVRVSLALLDAATKQRLVNIYQQEDLVCVVVICGVCRLVEVL
jgi:hypothetical protein